MPVAQQKCIRFFNKVGKSLTKHQFEISQHVIGAKTNKQPASSKHYFFLQSIKIIQSSQKLLSWMEYVKSSKL